MNKLTEVLKRFEDTEAQVMPMTRLQKYKLQNLMADLADGSCLNKASQVLQGVMEDKALFAKLDKAESQQEVLELLVDFLDNAVQTFEKNPAGLEVDTGFFKSLIARFGKPRHDTERADDEEAKDDLAGDAEKDLTKVIKDAPKDSELDKAKVDKKDALLDAEKKKDVTP